MIWLNMEFMMYVINDIIDNMMNMMWLMIDIGMINVYLEYLGL